MFSLRIHPTPCGEENAAQHTVIHSGFRTELGDVAFVQRFSISVDGHAEECRNDLRNVYESDLAEVESVQIRCQAQQDYQDQRTYP